MKERRNIRYISGRIWWMGMAVLALLVILTVTQAVLFFQGQGPIWNVLLTVAVLIGYLIAAVLWISRPYQQAEKTMERFLEGIYGYGRRRGAGSSSDPDDCRRDEVHGAFSAFSADDGPE